MTAIVLNTATGAVTEYDWTFQSMTDARAGGNAGLATLGGDTDAGAAISAQFLTGKPDGGGKMLGVQSVFVAAARGTGDGTLIVQGASASWEYAVAARASTIAKAKPGKGIREPRLGFGYRNTAGADFALDHIEAEIVESKTRRV
jgi:hypothetical protein